MAEINPNTAPQPITPDMTVKDALWVFLDLCQRAADSITFDCDDERLFGECSEPLMRIFAETHLRDIKLADLSKYQDLRRAENVPDGRIDKEVAILSRLLAIAKLWDSFRGVYRPLTNEPPAKRRRRKGVRRG